MSFALGLKVQVWSSIKGISVHRKKVHIFMSINTSWDKTEPLWLRAFYV